MTKTICGAIIGCVVLILSGCSTTAEEVSRAKPLYEEAKRLAEAGNYTASIERLESLQSKYPNGIYTEQAWLEKAYLWYLQDLYQTAELELKEFIRRYPKHENLDYAYFMLGLVRESPALTWMNAYLQKPSEKDVSFLITAKENYSRFLRLFPNSRYAPTVRKRLPILNHELSMHELRIAQFYQAADAWVAAINRGQIIIDRYPRTIAAREALWVMRDAYAALGIDSVVKDLTVLIDANPRVSSEPD